MHRTGTASLRGSDWPPTRLVGGRLGAVALCAGGIVALGMLAGCDGDVSDGNDDGGIADQEAGGPDAAPPSCNTQILQSYYSCDPTDAGVGCPPAPGDPRWVDAGDAGPIYPVGCWFTTDLQVSDCSVTHPTSVCNATDAGTPIWFNLL